jgi:RimJ/RimL family protein N-acetyltransferase
MKAGRIVNSLTAKDGRKIVLRMPKWEDLEDLLDLINSLVEEKAWISRAEKVSWEDEIEWLSGALARLEKDQVLYMVAEIDGHVVASSEITPKGGYEKHVGTVGIAIKDGYRDIGVGTEMMEELVRQARAMGLKVLTLNCFAGNERAIHVYRKVGFVETGRVPMKHLRDGKYTDDIIMTKRLD